MGRSLDWNSNHWKQIRRFVFKRDGYKCKRCGNRRQLSAHHIKPRSEGGVTTPRNLLTLCSYCHDWAELNRPKWSELIRYKDDNDDQKRFGRWYRISPGILCFEHDKLCQCQYCQSLTVRQESANNAKTNTVNVGIGKGSALRYAVTNSTI